jgi:hypothetical protein
MSSARITYTLRPSTTPQTELDALSRVYAFILQKHQEQQKAAPASRLDARKEDPNASGKPSLSQ